MSERIDEKAHNKKPNLNKRSLLDEATYDYISEISGSNGLTFTTSSDILKVNSNCVYHNATGYPFLIMAGTQSPNPNYSPSSDFSNGLSLMLINLRTGIPIIHPFFNYPNAVEFVNTCELNDGVFYFAGNTAAPTPSSAAPIRAYIGKVTFENLRRNTGDLFTINTLTWDSFGMNGKGNSNIYGSTLYPNQIGFFGDIQVPNSGYVKSPFLAFSSFDLVLENAYYLARDNYRARLLDGKYDSNKQVTLAVGDTSITNYVPLIVLLDSSKNYVNSYILKGGTYADSLQAIDVFDGDSKAIAVGYTSSYGNVNSKNCLVVIFSYDKAGSMEIISQKYYSSFGTGDWCQSVKVVGNLAYIGGTFSANNAPSSASQLVVNKNGNLVSKHFLKDDETERNFFNNDVIISNNIVYNVFGIQDTETITSPPVVTAYGVSKLASLFSCSDARFSNLSPNMQMASTGFTLSRDNAGRANKYKDLFPSGAKTVGSTSLNSPEVFLNASINANRSLCYESIPPTVSPVFALDDNFNTTNQPTKGPTKNSNNNNNNFSKVEVGAITAGIIVGGFCIAATLGYLCLRYVKNPFKGTKEAVTRKTFEQQVRDESVSEVSLTGGNDPHTTSTIVLSEINFNQNY